MEQDLIAKLVVEHHDSLISWRRLIHQYPGLGLNCEATADLVGETLIELGLDIKTGLAKTGVSAFLQGTDSKPVVGLRVDIDGLPIQEETELPFASKSPNRMHACGHDGHTAIGLGSVAVLGKMKDKIPGAVKFIFQPGEESESGARNMIADGVLKNPCPDAILGLHIDPTLDQGKFGICVGPTMAGTIEFELIIHGKGGHAAQPQTSKDPIAAAGHLITLLQTVISRQLDPLQPVVLSFGEISGGSCHSTIPDQVKLKGTFRFLENDIGSCMLEYIDDTIKGISSIFKVDILLEVIDRTPPLVTDIGLCEHLIEKARTNFGQNKICRISKPTMLGEDFSEFSSLVPSAFIRIGSFNPESGYIHGLHNPKFDFDENILPAGTEMVVFSIITLLKKIVR